MVGPAPLVALGLMSGTSLDGVDAAVVRTDGERILGLGPALTVPYDRGFRDRLRDVLGEAGDASGKVAAVARDLTLIHAEAVNRITEDAGSVDVIGFHGHTILHRPGQGFTHQIGDGALLARETGIPVIDDFRSRDVAAGGEGAPLAPLYHAARAGNLEKPVAVLNIGGVANVTWIGPGEEEILAFDTGPGNALIDDWTRKHTGQPFDEDGEMAALGRPDFDAVAALMADPYFNRPPPKSLDRTDFALDAVEHLLPEDGAATLVSFTAQAMAGARALLPAPPRRWLVSGGGRHNRAVMSALAEALEATVEPVEAVDWQGDMIEAQAFAFLAVRALYGFPLTLPSTTGVGEPTTGGTLHLVPGASAPA